MIRTMNIHEYKRLMGGSQATHQQWKEFIQGNLSSLLPSLDIEGVDVYNMPAERHNYRAGNEERLIIFLNAVGAHDGAVIHEGYLPPHPEHQIIAKDGDIILAQYNPVYNELTILFDVTKTYDTHHRELFTSILRNFEEQVWLPKTYENSWKHTQNKQALASRFTVQIKNQKERAIRDDERRITELEDRIRNYTRELKTFHDQITSKRRFVTTEREAMNNVGASLIKDLDLIIQNPKVSDLYIKDGKFIVHVPKVYAYDKHDKRYYIGNMRIELQPENAMVAFFGDNPRQSYWTHHDPHPHVNGRNGEGCLGNVAGTIAELSSQMQLYPLVLMCIDYLESVNIDDPAGRKVTNWDEVDEDGNIIRMGGEEPEEEDMEPSYTCSHCGEPQYDENDTMVYDGIDDDDHLYGERYVCPRCLDRHYHYNDDHEEYIAD